MSTGYGFTPLPAEVVRHDRSLTLAERISGRWFGRLELTCRVYQALHVGAGFKALRDGRAVRMIVRAGGVPVIPGSSMKGALRARFEAMTKSCAGAAPKAQKRIVSRTYNGAEVELSPEVRRSDIFTECDDGAQCAACALFGFQTRRSGQRSRVSVRDFVFADARVELGKMPEQYSPRLHHLGNFDVDRGGQRLTVTSLHGRKFAVGRSSAEVTQEQGVEVVPPQSIARGVITLFNLEPAELGGLLAALGRRPESAIKIGAGKGLGFGAVRIESVTYALKDAAGGRIEPDERGWREAFTRSADYHREGEGRLIELHRGEP